MGKNRLVFSGFLTYCLFLTLLIYGCVPKGTPPKTFVSVTEETGGVWKTIELRSDLTYDDAWQLLVDTLAKRWDIDELDEKTGYLRTAWSIETGIDKTMKGYYKYGKRITAKFSVDKKSLRVRTEAFYEVQIKGYYYIAYGIDNHFNEDAFSEISGKLARSTR